MSNGYKAAKFLNTHIGKIKIKNNIFANYSTKCFRQNASNLLKHSNSADVRYDYINNIIMTLYYGNKTRICRMFKLNKNQRNQTNTKSREKNI